jgi:flavin-dependent dehydrogenase
MFFVFPQCDGQARLYLNFPTEHRKRFSGPLGASRFLADFDLRCVPMSDVVRRSTPVGPCVSTPSYTTWLTCPPVAEGVVLIGDEAGANDPVLGTGLANALRDARMVSEVLLTSTTLEPGEFEPYVQSRKERMRRLRFAADLVCKVSAEFGPEAKDRRRRAWQRISENELYGVAKVAAFAGPEHAPARAFDPVVVERLLRPEASPTRTTARLGLAPKRAVLSG